MKLKNIRQYKIVDAYDVDSHLEGADYTQWTLYGSPFVSDGNVYQAVVSEEDKIPTEQRRDDGIF